jgi:hypothetical protein
MVSRNVWMFVKTQHHVVLFDQVGVISVILADEHWRGLSAAAYRPSVHSWAISWIAPSEIGTGE